MKKKIMIGVFLLLLVITAIVFVMAAINAYHYDMQYHSDDKWAGFGAVISIMVGGFVVFYELDLFYTVYYFFIKPRTTTKSILNILANFTLLSVFFTDTIAHFLFRYISQVFGEETIVLVALFCIYILLRIVYAVVSVGNATKEN